MATPSDGSRDSSPPLSLRRKLLFITIVFGFLFVAAEILTRGFFAITGRDIRDVQPQFMTSSSNVLRFVRHPFLPYANRPGDERTIRMANSWPVDGSSHRDIHVRINNLGFRGEDTGYPKPSGTIRVVCLGGSTTFGSVSDGLTWPERLEEELGRRFPGPRFEVLNLGTDAGVSHSDLINLAFHGVHFQPDLVILYQGANDMTNWGYDNFRPDYSHSIHPLEGLPTSTKLSLAVPRVVWKSYLVCWAATTLRRYTGIAPSLRSATMDQKAARDTVDPIDNSWAFFSNVRSMRAVARENGAGFLAATFHVFNPDSTTVRFNRRMRELCAREGIPMVDVDQAIPHQDRTLQVDGMHFSPRGEVLMAATMAGAIVGQGLLDSAIAGLPAGLVNPRHAPEPRTLSEAPSPSRSSPARPPRS